MFWFWLSVISILILTCLAIFWAVRLRKRRLERKLRLEITNQGNVESHYQLRVEELSGQLEFLFSSGGNRLPEVVDLHSSEPGTEQPESQPQPASSRPVGSGTKPSWKMQKAMSLSYGFASLLTSLGAILPRGIGSHLTQAGSQLQRGQAQASRVQQVSSQAASLASSSRTSPAAPVRSNQPQHGARAAQGLSWFETPAIPPGETLSVDLLVCSTWISGAMTRSFQIMSHSTEGGPGRMIVEDGRVQIRGGFWSHRIFPHLLILTLAILALFLAVWIARMNNLPV